MDERARSIIRKQGRLYTERLLSAVMESGFDLKAVPVVMLGGGASVVKGNVSPQDGLCRVFALTDDRVNAEGFERILGQFSGGLGKGLLRPVLCSDERSARRSTAGRGRSCRPCRKVRKALFWCRRFWRARGQMSWKPLCVRFCEKNSRRSLPGLRYRRKKPSRSK